MGNKQTKKKLSKEDLEYLVNNTKFTKNEIKDWYRGFMVIITHTSRLLVRLDCFIILSQFYFYYSVLYCFVKFVSVYDHKSGTF